MTALPADRAGPPEDPDRVVAGVRTRRSARIALLDALIRVAPHLPATPLVLGAELAGEVRYRFSPTLAGRVRGNLRRVCDSLVEQGLATTRVRRAAADPRALERLVRSAFRHHARTYLELILAPSVSGEALERRLSLVNAPVVGAALRPGNQVILVGLHLGPIELPARFVRHRTGMPGTAPMETLGDPELQAWLVRTRASVGLRIVGLGEARRELLAALGRGENVGIVGDRDITGGGMPVELFGAPAPLPIGAALLSVETGLPVFVGAFRRVGRSRYRGELIPLDAPAAGTRRERVLALLHAEARAFERIIAPAPDQWWSVFFSIWPDLEPAAEHEGSRV